jgi:hypothetical protein
MTVFLLSGSVAKRINLVKSSVLMIILLSLAGRSTAQLRDSRNLDNHDDKPYYFGIVLGYNSSHYNITHHPYFLANDTVMSVNSENSGRVHLGILINWQASRRFDVRFYPLNLIFTEKKLVYTQKYPNQGDNSLTQVRKVEGITLSFPLQVRLKSDRIGNFRVYSLAGMKYDYDLASNAGARNADDFVKVKKGDFGVEAGVGFQFFFKYFIFSPEIKISQGLSNVHVRDESLKYSAIIDQMKSRMIMISLQFEGGGGN